MGFGKLSVGCCGTVCSGVSSYVNEFEAGQLEDEWKLGTGTSARLYWAVASGDAKNTSNGFASTALLFNTPSFDANLNVSLTATATLTSNSFLKPAISGVGLGGFALEDRYWLEIGIRSNGSTWHRVHHESAGTLTGHPIAAGSVLSIVATVTSIAGSDVSVSVSYRIDGLEIHSGVANWPICFMPRLAILRNQGPRNHWPLSRVEYFPMPI